MSKFRFGFGFTRDSARGSVLLGVPLLLLGVGLMFWARAELRIEQEVQLIELEEQERTPLYLPSARYVKLITLGFDRFAADILWFNTLNYFGKQYDGKKDFRWLGHMCDLVSSLDPQAEHVYEFCATLLSWIAKAPKMSSKLLGKAIAARPNYWRYHYLRGFTNWYFLERKDLAQNDFSDASRMPDAPPFLASLATRLMVSEERPETAIQFLNDLVEHTSDDTAKAALKDQLKLAYISRDRRLLKSKCEEFESAYGERPGSMQSFVEKGVFQGIPLDPYRKPYAFEEGSCEVIATSGKKGLEFFGKTAKTGLAQMEPD